MTTKRTISAKIARPSLSGVIYRERLFNILDTKTERPVTWVSSTAGSGKTKLVAGYLDARRELRYHAQSPDRNRHNDTVFINIAGLRVKKQKEREL